MMRFKVLLLGALAIGCSEEQSSQFSLSIDLASPADPKTFKPSDDPVAYADNGSFFVRVTALAAETVTVQPGSSPLSASLRIMNEAVVTGAISAATVLLLPDSSNNSYSGVGTLAWPPAQQVDLAIAAAGNATLVPITIADPLPSNRPTIMISQPPDGTKVAPGTLVAIGVAASYPASGTSAFGVTLNFQIAATPTLPVASLPNSTIIVPTTVTTDKSGNATATLLMPQLGSGGVLYIEAVGPSSRSAGISLISP
jgi:hypothetical protein